MRLTADGSRLFLFANDGVSGPEPWVSDGTAAGTTLLADLNPGRSLHRALRTLPPAPLGSTV